jgi:hypothetical protein
MIKTKIKSIVNAREAMQRLAQQTLPVAVSYRVTKLIRAIDAELAVYDKERIRLCEKYGKLNESKTSYTILEGAEFNEEHSLLLNFDVELEAHKVKLPETLNITPADLLRLSEFVEIEGVSDD